MDNFDLWACSSVRLERTPDKREVDGSIPSRPTMFFGGVAQLGERLPCTQEAIGSSPFTSTIEILISNLEVICIFLIWISGLQLKSISSL
jgi:hypothetical protein